MVIRHSLAGLVSLTLLCGSIGCTNAGKDDRAELMKDVDAALTYAVVAKDIDKHIGKRVAWHGLLVGSHASPKVANNVQIEYYTYLPTAANSGVDFEKPFMFNTSDGKDMRTDAGKKVEDKHRQLIIGTIAGSGEFKYEVNAEKKQKTAPILKDVSIHEPAGK